MDDHDRLIMAIREYACQQECGLCPKRNETCIHRYARQAADAIEELKQIAEHYEETAMDYYKDVCYYLDRVPKWIPVTERLPEEYTRVIGFMAWKAMTAIEYQNGKWYLIDHLETLPDEAVTHWMPLPEPPKEG